MRRLLAILLVVATPAWAMNEQEPPTRPSNDAEWIAAQELCLRLKLNVDICAMKNAHLEARALAVAKGALDLCDKDTTRAGCDATRAYIKQRWGY